MNFLKKIGLLVLAIISLDASAQTDKATTSKIVDQKNYVFIATTVIPMNSPEIMSTMNKISGTANGGLITLSDQSYDMKVTPDSLIAYLPYYGRSYTATFNGDENGYKFTSKNFTYKTSKRKKGGWDVTIYTRDIKDNVRMDLTVSENGYASLSVSSSNKQAITYNGYLQEKKAL